MGLNPKVSNQWLTFAWPGTAIYLSHVLYMCQCICKDQNYIVILSPELWVCKRDKGKIHYPGAGFLYPDTAGDCQEADLSTMAPDVHPWLYSMCIGICSLMSMMASSDILLLGTSLGWSIDAVCLSPWQLRRVGKALPYRCICMCTGVYLHIVFVDNWIYIHTVHIPCLCTHTRKQFQLILCRYRFCLRCFDWCIYRTCCVATQAWGLVEQAVISVRNAKCWFQHIFLSRG